MHPKLATLYNRIEANRRKLLREVVSINENKFAQSGLEGKWSVSQILTHIMIAERLSLGYMKKKYLGIAQLDNSGIVEDLKLLLLKISQRMPFKFKAPPIVVQHTPAPLPLPQLMEQWDAVRSELLHFMEGFDNKNIRKKIYKHPVVGRLDIYQAVSFFNEHVNHHWPQVKRFLKN